jgi:hypothetical protein
VSGDRSGLAVQVFTKTFGLACLIIFPKELATNGELLSGGHREN